MFLGTHEPRLDDKGRLILPAKFREELSSGLVITKGQNVVFMFFHQQSFQLLQRR
jgi:MraZ protein